MTQYLYPGYETTFITRTEMAEDALKALVEKITASVKQFDGEIILNEDWGKRKLAYTIQKESRGQYTHIVYTAKAGVVSEVERMLKLNDQVFRFLTVRLTKEFDASVFAENRAVYQSIPSSREKYTGIRKKYGPTPYAAQNWDRPERFDRGDRYGGGGFGGGGFGGGGGGFGGGGGGYGGGGYGGGGERSDRGDRGGERKERSR